MKRSSITISGSITRLRTISIFITSPSAMKWALSNGLRTYRTSPFNYEAKMHLRLALEPADLFVRHRSPLFNGMLRGFAPRFSPTRSDPVSRRHFSARS